MLEPPKWLIRGVARQLQKLTCGPFHAIPHQVLINLDKCGSHTAFIDFPSFAIAVRARAALQTIDPNNNHWGIIEESLASDDSILGPIRRQWLTDWLNMSCVKGYHNAVQNIVDQGITMEGSWAIPGQKSVQRAICIQLRSFLVFDFTAILAARLERWGPPCDALISAQKCPSPYYLLP